MKKNRSFDEVRIGLKNNSLTCESITIEYIEEIRKSNLNAFVEVFEEEALKKAKEVDIKLNQGNAGKLAGMVIGIKDNISYKGHQMSASSNILKNYTAIYNATCVKKLLKEDAIIIGRLNCDEFAMGSSNENSIYGPVKNPHDINKVPGGSSGGSAAAVSAGLCLAALGSDTGGSIRQPASFCGVYGLKPTYGRVSRYGLVAYASSFDQIGPIANTVEDIALILEVISGHDELDSTSSTHEVPKFSVIKNDEKKSKIAVIKEALYSKNIDIEIQKTILLDIKNLRNNGNVVDEVSFPYLDYLVPTYYVISTAEASSNLSRYDGIRYGHRAQDVNSLEETYIKTRSEGFGEEVKRRIMLGTFVLSEEYQEAYFTKAQKIRRLIQEETNKILNTYDFILTPTTPHTAFDIGLKRKDPTKLYLEDIFTVQANLTGHPAISLPKHTHKNGLPFGVQLLTRHFNEAELLKFSACQIF